MPGATKMNEVSSRSHAVCIIIVEKCSGGAGAEAASPGGAAGLSLGTGGGVGS
jgi:kinesin family protein 3/17